MDNTEEKTEHTEAPAGKSADGWTSPEDYTNAECWLQVVRDVAAL